MCVNSKTLLSVNSLYTKHYISSSTPKQYDMVIVGAGIVGVAAAREISIRYPHMKCAVIDKESSIGK